MRRCNVGSFGLAAGLVALVLANAPTLLLAANVCEQESRWSALGRAAVLHDPGRADGRVLRPQWTDVRNAAEDCRGRDGRRCVRHLCRRAQAAGVRAGAGERLRAVRERDHASLRTCCCGWRSASRSTSARCRCCNRGSGAFARTRCSTPRSPWTTSCWSSRPRKSSTAAADTIVPYELDWGLEDDISEHNAASRIPYEYFRELARLNAALHVPDARTQPLRSNHHVRNSKTHRGEWRDRHHVPDGWTVPLRPQREGHRVPEEGRQVPGRQ